LGERRASPIEEIVETFCAPLTPAARAAFSAFILFATAARDAACDPALPAPRRQALLDGLEALLIDRKPEVPLALPLSAAARDLAATFAAAGADLGHARHLLQALRQDCAKTAYRDWADWLLFARFAAAPFGRLWIDAAGEDKAALPAAEALACALLLLGQTQSAAAAYRRSGKVYLPERWLRTHQAAPADLALPAATPSWQAVFAEAARAARQLLNAATPLPGVLRQPAQRKAAAAGLALSGRWAARLAKLDPLGGTARLSGFDRWRARMAAWRT
jgi:phytoene/squalene synthetase